MARPTEKTVLVGTVIPTADITTPHRFMSAANEGALCTTSGEVVRGVLQESAAANEQTPVAEIGHLIVEAGAAVAKGVAVQTDASARAITLASGSKAGVALSAATSAGELILVRIPA